jgi:hypothetical protein
MLHIFRILAEDMSLGSLASLSVVNRSCRDLTLPLLYEKVILHQNIKDKDKSRLERWMNLNSAKCDFIK